MNDLDEFDALVAGIEARATMFIEARSLSRLRAFLDGWSIGRAHHLAGSKYLVGFREYVVQRLHAERFEGSWERIITYFARDERDAYEMFFTFYKEFRQQSQSDNEGRSSEAS